VGDQQNQSQFPRPPVNQQYQAPNQAQTQGKQGQIPQKGSKGRLKPN
jgi:hypothetical protein